MEENKRNILLTISYDGTDFCGWQRQDNKKGFKNDRTVQEEIEKALEKLHKQKVILYGSGRTDSGVHAIGQAANFYSPIDSIPVKNYIRALNSILPSDIRIMDADEKPSDFNARFNATSRVYRYFINPSEIQNAAMSRFTWNIRNYTPNIQKLNKLSACLKGEIDCASFAAAGDESISTNRYLNEAFFFIQKDTFGNDLLVFQIEANAFLWKMVRTLTGTIINLDRLNKDDDSLQKILIQKDRTKAGVTAPSEGLFLYKINFDGIRRHV
ncbi:MAG: tRNA pseudouridine(38-40) synthase TruA [Treponema sp.]|jgi:tRNA pseudouridine38-40 synthase|nr:tRNA pseudouridine(38-40) synthase TruA [Treponema sp.]